MARLRLLLLVLLITPSAALAEPAREPLTADEVPPLLRPWVDWALDGETKHRCAFDAQGPVCDFPGDLAIAIAGGVARFSVQIESLAGGIFELPGSLKRWPEEVKVDGRPAAVLPRGERPTIRLSPGRHLVEGRIVFREAPESLEIPKRIGLVSLTLDGRRVPAPNRREDGTLWFEGAGTKREVEDTLEIEVYRRIEDGVPLRVVTRLVLDVSGLVRKVELGDALLEGVVPVSVSSTLPVRVEADGSLTVQVMAGKHEIEIVGRLDAPGERLARPATAVPWPAEEIWVFRADDELRQVELQGVDYVDPSRTNLPADFRGLPTYLVPRDGVVRLETLRRGIATLPPDALSLHREIRLDLDGGGYSVRDTFHGELRRAHRLDLVRGQLGRVALDGEEQLITTSGEVEGVEVRAARLQMEADSRLERTGSVLPAVGWSEDVQSLAATLHLPPGYALLGVAGVDSASGTWIERWNLGAIFFVLVVTLALFNLAGPVEALVAFLALVVTWGEPDAPRWVWILVLAFAALTPRLPEGGFRTASKVGLVLSLLGLVIVAVPFAREQIKNAVYPQTADVGYGFRPSMPFEGLAHVARELDELGYYDDAEEEGRAGGLAPPTDASLEPKRAVAPEKSSALSSASRKSNLLAQDPNATVQTGPGIPKWTFTSHDLRWDGPVAADHTVRLFLVTPPLYRLLSILRVLAILGLAYAFYRAYRRGGGGRRAVAAGATALALAVAIAGAASTAAAEPPPQPLLDELRARMLRDPSCAPDCVEVSLLSVELRDGVLRGTLAASAGTDATLRIPGPAAAFVPSKLEVDKRPAGAVLGEDGYLRVRLTEGVHVVEFAGALPDPNALQLGLGEIPRRAEVRAEGYHVRGLRPDGQVEATLRFDREVAEGEVGAGARNEQNLAPWLEVVRTFEIGVQWEVVTEVRRVSPLGSAVSFSIPLVEGETVTTEGVRQVGARAEITLDRDAAQATFRSRLPIREAITLKAPTGVPYSQIWRVRCGTVYACEPSGIAPVALRDGDLVAPLYRPFPGEALTLRFERPSAAEGRSTTLDRAELVVEPGVRRVSSRLELSVRSSRGDALTLTLPADARVESVEANGKSQPIQLEGQKLTVRVDPGSTQVVIRFQEARGLGLRHEVPAIELGASAVDVTTVVKVPENRWLLAVQGPSWGPAVLFWGKLVFVLLAAFLLAKVPSAPIGFGSFALLGLGLAQTGVIPALVVAAWFFAFAQREQKPEWAEPWFNLRQVALPILTLAAVGILWFAIYDGLLGIPDMQVEGNGSWDKELRFYVDRIEGALPTVAVYSVPIWVYRVSMLAWALWLAFAAVRWARWSFEAYGKGGFWKTSPKRTPPPKRAPSAPLPPASEPPAEPTPPEGEGARPDEDV